MAYNGAIYAGTLLDINVAAAGSLTVMSPLISQVDFTLFGSLGLSSLQSNLQAQLSSALKSQVDISLSLTNPIAAFAQALAGIGALVASLTEALAGAAPVASLDVAAQLSATAAFAASLGAQVAGLDALIQGGIAAKTPAVSFAGSLAGSLSAGPVFVLSWESITMASAGASINTDFSTGLSIGPNSILPGETVYGVLLVTKAPSAWAAIQATILA